MMRVGSLFSGIGGFDLAARWMGWETIWFSEIDPYASRVLEKHWPGVPNLGDITTIDWSHVERPDILCGGFPCQDISNAGPRVGIEGARSGLWSEFARAIGDLRPHYVVVENVAALLGRGVERVLGDLAALGYDAEWQVLSAQDVGAPHLRERLWIIAYPNTDEPGLEGWHGGLLSKCTNKRVAGTVGPSVAHPTSQGLAQRIEQEIPRGTPRTGKGTIEGSERCSGVDDGPTDWQTEPDVGRVAHGVPARVDRVRGLGNAIVPQCALLIFQAIADAEAKREAGAA